MSNWKKFRKKPVVIEAFKMTGKLMQSLGKRHDVCDCKTTTINYNGVDFRFRLLLPAGGLKHENSYRVEIGTLEGPHIVSPDDFIIKGIKGEVYACKPDIFRDTYDEVQNGR